MSAIITVQDVTKSFGAREVLRGVSFALHERERVGLLGINGSGKSTLMRLIGAACDPDGTDRSGDVRDQEPDTGLITRRRDLDAIYVPQEPRLDPAATILDTLLSGLRAHPHDEAGPPAHEAHTIAAGLRLPEAATPVGRLSIGERRRVALGRALLGRPQLLLLDEPTNHLDADTVAWLEQRLMDLPGALLLVSHDRYFLDRVVGRILELDRGKVHDYGTRPPGSGGYRHFLEKQQARLLAEARADHERAAFLRRELSWVRAGTPARTTKQKARLDRFADAVTEQQKEELRPADREMALVLPMAQRLGKTILELRGLGKTQGGKVLFRDLTLVLKPGDRIGVVGPNGAGKTTLMRTLLGEVLPDSGEVVVGQSTRLAFLDQGRAALRDDHSVLEEVAGDSDFCVIPAMPGLPGGGKVHVRTFLRRMLFDDRFADALVATLSGGERNRVQLARLLRQGGNLLLLDEPTNDLDLFTLGVLEEALANFPGCAFIVSHDRWFLDRVATAILAFEPDVRPGQVSYHEGNYSTYLSRRQAEQAEAAEAQRPDRRDRDRDRDRDRPPPPRRLTFREQRELEGMESAIGAAEQRVLDLETTLADPNIYKDRGTEVPGLLQELEQARAQVDALYHRWQELDALPRA